MLGRNSFTKAEVDGAKARVADLRAAYDGVGTTDAFDRLFATSLLLALDRPFVHRTRGAAGKAGTPLNELELYVSALLDHDGVLQESSVIKLKPAESVLGIGFGERVSITVEQFDRLAAAVFTELEAKLLDG